jgi:hypothetical protein
VAENETSAGETIVELDELLVRPGTYFNPQTEVLVVVDDSSSLDQEIFNMEVYEGAEWVRLSDEIPIDEERRDEQLEIFQAHYHPGSGAVVGEEADEQLDHIEPEAGDDKTIIDPSEEGGAPTEPAEDGEGEEPEPV